MKRKMLLSLAGAFVLAIAGITPTQAQNNTLLGPRFLVHAPGNIAGQKSFRASNSGEATANDWGRAIDSTWINMDLVKASDTTGCTALGPLNDKFVLIYRTTCMFSEKAFNAQQAGAAGVVIVNNVPGQIDFVMSPGTNAGSVTIPVIIIPKEIGDAINQELSNSQTVTVSLTNWGMGLANDLHLLNGALPPYGAIPKHQLTGSPSAYNFYTGALIANTGSADQTNVVVSASLDFYPTGSTTPTNVYTSATTPETFNVLDSILIVANTTTNVPNPSGEGKYTLNYDVQGANTDGFNFDNTQSMDMYVTTNVFCKGRFDVNTGNPIVTGGNRFASTAINEYTWGPLIYVNNGGYQAIDAKLVTYTSDSTQDSTMHVYQGTQRVWLFKWRDTVDVNNVIEPTELTVVGISEVQFPNNSTSGSVFNTNTFTDPYTQAPVVLEGNTWYWLAAVTPNSLFLGTDNAVPYYSRIYAAEGLTTPIRENFQAQYPDGVDELGYTLINITDSVYMYPFSNATYSYQPIDSIPYTFTQYMPNISLTTSPWPLSVKNITSNIDNRVSVYPNPAVNSFNVDVNFSEIHSNVNVDVLDYAGRTILKQSKNGIKTGTVNFSTQGLAAGQYYIRVTAGKESITKAFTVMPK